MSDFRKARILLTAVYKSGEVLDKLQEQAVPARVNVTTIPNADKFRELSLRLVVDSKNAEELLEGLCHGSVALSIEQIPSVAERLSNPQS